MRKYIKYLPIVLFIVAVTLDKVLGTIQGVQFALFGIDDALLIAGGSALAGGIANLFGGDDEEEKINAYLANIEKTKGKYLADVEKRKIEMYRANEASKKKMLSSANQKAAQAGFDPVASSYANEEGLDNGLQNNLSALNLEKAKQIMAFENMKSEAELGKSNTSDLELFVEGGLEGANLGSKLMNMFTSPSMPKTTPETTPLTTGQVDTKGLLEMKSTLNPEVDVTNPVIQPFPKSTGLKNTNKVLDFAEATGQGDFSPTTFDEFMAKRNPKRYRLKNLIG